LKDSSKAVGSFLDELWRRNPVEASFAGIHDYDHEIGDFSKSAIEDEVGWLRSQLAGFEQTDLSGLSLRDAQDARLMMSMIRGKLLRMEDLRVLQSSPILYPELCMSGCFILCAREYAPLEERLLSVTRRLSLVPRLLEQARRNLSAPPPVWLSLAVATTQGAIGFIRDELASLFSEVPSLENDYEKSSRAALSALGSYARFLGEEVVPGPESSYATGKDAFEFLLREEHMLDRDSQSLLAFGEEWVDRTEQELEKLALDIGSSDDWRKLVLEGKKNHPGPDELVAYYREKIDRAKRFVIDRNLVSLHPNERLDVIPTPRFERVFLPYAAYMPAAPFEEEQKGLYFVTTVDEDAAPATREEQLRGHNTYKAAVTALHEAYPGHHLQMTLSNSHPSRVRRLFSSNLFIEGWALYCEEMMYEEGFYPDPMTRLFQVKDTLWRACRVVLDVKLHLGLVSFDQATQFLVERAGLEKLNALREVGRYTLSPTQPMSYLVGREEILALRERVKKRKPRDFDLRRFHDRLLGQGSVPPALLSSDSFFP
jgi:hypothetical protein